MLIRHAFICCSLLSLSPSLFLSFSLPLLLSFSLSLWTHTHTANLTCMCVHVHYSVMYNGINSVSPLDSRTPRGPKTENIQYAGLYFVLYMLIVMFVFVNMFVGFVIVTFQEVGVKAFRETKLDRNQVCVCDHLCLCVHT